MHLADDLNTPKAQSLRLHELRSEAGKGVKAGRELPQGERATDWAAAKRRPPNGLRSAGKR